MSIIFGICKAQGQAVHDAELTRVASPTSRYSHDGTSVRSNGRIGMGFQPYRTHRRSILESQPVWDEYGNMLVLDGRIDNHRELRHDMGIIDGELADSKLVLTAFQYWKEQCFSKFVGDWALALWIDQEAALYLARDHAGTRTLYFEQRRNSILWSTHLDTFFANGEARNLEEHFIVSFISGMPAGNLTPYRGIEAVQPAHYHVFRSGHVTARAHWDWHIAESIHYRDDKEYEEHFFALFQQSVARRSGIGTPVLAQLSGGMDSSSIVAMSDHLRHGEGTETIELIDTVSFFDDAEPSWDERPYFSAVESYRGKTGIHIEASFSNRDYEPLDPTVGTYYFPVGDRSAFERETLFLERMEGRDYRSILSGIGGDEVLGGVPDCFPELADYLCHLDLTQFTQQAVKWCMAKRLPFFALAWDTVRKIPPLYRDREPKLESISVPWITPHLQLLHQEMNVIIPGSAEASKWRTPSSIIKANSWRPIIENLPHKTPGILRRYEYLYPYLDKDFIDFIYRIPREQLVRPGQRRSLMKRALKSILPSEVLHRNSKGYVSKGPVASLVAYHAKLDSLLRNSYAAAFGYIRPDIARLSLKAIAEGRDHQSWAAMLRTISLELWLRSMGSCLSGINSPASSTPSVDALSR